MKLLEKIKNKKETKTSECEITIKDNMSLIEMSEYMLVEVRKEDINNNKLMSIANNAISTLGKSGGVLAPIVDNISKEIITTKNNSETLYKIINIKKGDELKYNKKNKAFWGAIKKKEGNSELAKLKEVKLDNALDINPANIMLAFAVYEIEKDLNEIKEISKKIISFLEKDKEAEIEADLETLKTTLQELKYNTDNKQYLSNNHKHVMDIKRTAKKNMLFYKKQITDDLKNEKLFTTNQIMKNIQKDLENKFKYYRLSLFIYSFSSLLEISLLSNYQEEYLLSKKNELKELDDEYLKEFTNAREFVFKTSNKSLEGNVLSGLGSAEKAIGSLAEKVSIIKDRKVDEWLNDNGEKLKQKGREMNESFVNKFEELKESTITTFVNKIENINNIYNNSNAIYFDKNCMYLEYN